MNAGVALVNRYRAKYRFTFETSLDLDGWPSTPDILSTFINLYKPLSTFINPYQPLSTFINPYQLHL